MFASAEPNARRMLAHGFRNPVRLAIRPGTNDVWVGGPRRRLLGGARPGAEPTDPVRNFGWPCYEGGLDANGVPYARIRPRSDDQDLDICENLYADGTATSAPYWGYDHELPVVQGEDCDDRCEHGRAGRQPDRRRQLLPGSGSFPAAYHNALFFADRLRNCMWAMLPGPDGLPKRGRVIPFGSMPSGRSTSRSRPAATSCTWTRTTSPCGASRGPATRPTSRRWPPHRPTRSRATGR